MALLEPIGRVESRSPASGCDLVAAAHTSIRLAAKTNPVHLDGPALSPLAPSLAQPSNTVQMNTSPRIESGYRVIPATRAWAHPGRGEPVLRVRMVIHGSWCLLGREFQVSGGDQPQGCEAQE